MTTKAIKRGKSGFTLETERPDSWALDSTVTVDVIDKASGTAIVEDVSASVYAGDTLASAVEISSYELPLTTGNAIAAGETFRVGDENTEYQLHVVESYDPDTDTITTKKATTEALNAGANVVGQKMTAVIDASLDAYDNLDEVLVKWKSDGDGRDMPETWRVLSKENEPSGIAASFRLAYPSVFDYVDEDSIDELKERAEQALIKHFEMGQRDYDKIQDPELVKEALMAKMALFAGVGGEMGDQQYLRIAKLYGDELDVLDSLPIWTDDDEDDTEDEGEVNKANETVIMRGL